jgi:diguanylate cyclase (GGDEF)-like protein/PAS domain S-box-containing protein
MRGERDKRLVTRGEVCVIAVYFLVALTSIVLTRNSAGSSLLWPANAITGALLVRLPVIRWTRIFPGVLCAGILANVMGAHDSPLGSLGMAVVDLLEVGLTASLFRFYAQLSFPNITVVSGVQMLAFVGIGIPAVAALPGAIAVNLTFGTPFWSAAANWYTAIAAGAILCAPPIYLYSHKALQRLASPDVRSWNLLLAAVCLVVTYCAIRYARFPLIVLSIPLIVIAFQVGAFGAALMCELVGLLVVVLWYAGVRPLGSAVPLSETGALAGLPFVALAAIMLSPIVMGLAAEERERAMRALRYNEQRFRQSLRHSPAGVVIRGLDGKLTMANDAFLEMLGYTWEEVSKLTAEQLVHADEHDASARDMQHLVEGGADTYVAERRYRHRDGSWVWTRVAVSLATDDDGTPLHFIGHIESLEARRRAERDLAEERERLRTTLRAIADAVITTDAVGQITYVNAAAENLLGQRLDEIAGWRLDEVVVLTNPQTLKVTQSMFALCLARGESAKRQDRCLLHRPDGSPCYIVDAASPVHDSEGAVSGVVVVLQDATEDVERDRELSHRAAHDPLTGLTNRFEFERRLSECVERYRHIQRPATLLLIDLDRFKAVNDTGGHAAGDEVLRRVAQVLTSIIRDSDAVSRLGGDEFAILLTHSDPAHAELVGLKVLRAVTELRVTWNGAVYTVGASIGAASLRPGLATFADWAAAADRACYEAKRAGRGQMRVAA